MDHIIDPSPETSPGGSRGNQPSAVSVGVPGQRDSAYEVRIGWGTVEAAGDWLPRRCPAHRYVIVSDDVVAELHGARLVGALEAAGLRADIITFPAGERNKTRASWAAVTDRMLEMGIGRDGAVIAFGGGVTGDLAGFVAATYLRGIPYVQIPTTLLAMIDSSVGGKTGVDTAMGKNLVGAFHPPAGVLADLELLRTLPERELRAGFAEAIKHGAIADRAYFDTIAGHAERLVSLDGVAVAELVRRSVEIKSGVVAADEREGGPRKMLNFGHTIGHAVEAESGYDLLHGEAVAIGMVIEGRIGEAMGVTAAGTSRVIADVLSAFGLPNAMPVGMSAERVLGRTRADKKARSGLVEYALIEAVGRAARAEDGWSVVVPDEVVRGVL